MRNQIKGNLEVKFAYDENQLKQLLEQNYVIDIKPIIWGVKHETSVYTNNADYDNRIKYMVIIGVQKNE